MSAEFVAIFLIIIFTFIAEILKDSAEHDDNRLFKLFKRVFAKYLELLFVGAIVMLLLRFYIK